MNFFDLNGAFYDDFFQNNPRTNSQARFFSKFTSNAKQIILDAFEISKNKNSNQTTVDHLFVALLKFEKSELNLYLSNNGLDINAILSQAAKSIPVRSETVNPKNINLGPEISRHLNSIFKYAMAKVDVKFLSQICLNSKSEFIQSLIIFSLASLTN